MIDTPLLLVGGATAMGIYLVLKAFMGGKPRKIGKEFKTAPFLQKRHRLLTNEYGLATIVGGKIVDRDTGQVCLSLLPENSMIPARPYYFLDEIEPIDKLNLLLGVNIHKLKGVEIDDKKIKVLEELKKKLEEKRTESETLQSQLYESQHYPERYTEKATERAERLIRARAKIEEKRKEE